MSVEERLNSKEQQMDKLVTRFIQCLMFLWPVMGWLSNVKIMSSLLIISSPFVILYSIFLLRFLKKYKRLKADIKELRSLQRKKEFYYPTPQALYFRRD